MVWLKIRRYDILPFKAKFCIKVVVWLKIRRYDIIEYDIPNEEAGCGLIKD